MILSLTSIQDMRNTRGSNISFHPRRYSVWRNRWIQCIYHPNSNIPTNLVLQLPLRKDQCRRLSTVSIHRLDLLRTSNPDSSSLPLLLLLLLLAITRDCLPLVRYQIFEYGMQKLAKNCCVLQSLHSRPTALYSLKMEDWYWVDGAMERFEPLGLNLVNCYGQSTMPIRMELLLLRVRAMERSWLLEEGMAMWEYGTWPAKLTIWKHLWKNIKVPKEEDEDDDDYNVDM